VALSKEAARELPATIDLIPDELRTVRAYAALAAFCVTLAACAQPERTEETTPLVSAPPSVSPATSPEVETATGFMERGRISIYGKAFAGKRTASGDLFDPERLTMAHPTLPFGTRVRVTNLENHRSVEVTVNDRGPFVPGRIADLSARAARQIGMAVDSVVEGLLEVLRPSRAR
jgi:peptidoglycan lytic transglycosylase